MINLSNVNTPQETGLLLDYLNAHSLALNSVSPGVLNAQGSTAGVGNAADTTDDTTFSYIVPANYLVNNIANRFLAAARPMFDGLRITAFGQSAVNGNNKTFKLKMGATTLISSGVVTINNKSWKAEALVMRSASKVQQIYGQAISDQAVVAQGAYAAGALDDTTALTIAVTNASPTTGAAGDLLTNAFIVERLV